MPRYSESYYNEDYYTLTFFEAGFTIRTMDGVASVYSALTSDVFFRFVEGKPEFNPELAGKFKRKG